MGGQSKRSGDGDDLGGLGQHHRPQLFNDQATLLLRRFDIFLDVDGFELVATSLTLPVGTAVHMDTTVILSKLMGWLASELEPYSGDVTDEAWLFVQQCLA
jgi:hypothetical protein